LAGFNIDSEMAFKKKAKKAAAKNPPDPELVFEPEISLDIPLCVD